MEAEVQLPARNRAYDKNLYERIDLQLRAQGIHRGPGAIKNEWNRRGRAASGIEERKNAKSGQLATSVQHKK
jgi:hypothetical protein